MECQISQLRSCEQAGVLEIYRMGIETRLATFETRVPTWEDWDANHLVPCRLAAYVDQRLAGWGALSAVSKREVYAGVAEVSIYIHADFRGMGVGKKLLRHLVECSEAAGFWTLQASIFPENSSSLRLFQGCGFRVMGRREKIARLDNVWRDTLILERRRALPANA